MSVEHFGDDVDRGKYADGRTYNEARNGACTELAALTKPLMRGRSSPHERSDMRDQHYRRITTRMSLRSSGLRKRVIPKSVVAVFGQDHAQEKGSGTPADALCLAPHKRRAGRATE